jgi:hypothetical protein
LNVSSELRSSLFARAFFTWLFPVLYRGYKSVISPDDLPAINEKVSSKGLAAKVGSRWNKSEFYLNTCLLLPLVQCEANYHQGLRREPFPSW